MKALMKVRLKALMKIYKVRDESPDEGSFESPDEDLQGEDEDEALMKIYKVREKELLKSLKDPYNFQKPFNFRILSTFKL